MRTRTTTRTLPPGDEASWQTTGTETLSRARRDGLDAVDRRLAAEAAEVETVLGLVMPVVWEAPLEETEEEEVGPLPGPGPWSMG